MRNNRLAALGVAALALLLLAMGLNACQSAGSFGQELMVPVDKRIALAPGGPHSGATNTSDLTVSYEYQLLDPQTLHLSGRISGVQWRSDSITVSVMFTDAEGRVLERQLVYSTGYRPSTYELRTWGFDRQLKPPAGTTAMAFSSLVQESRGHR
jgi:hypothetical protein